MRVGRQAIDALFDVHHTQYSLGSASGVLCKLDRSYLIDSEMFEMFRALLGITESMVPGRESTK